MQCQWKLPVANASRKFPGVAELEACDSNFQLPTNAVMRQKKPLIYFFGIIPGVYVPQWPVFLTQDNMANLNFTLAFHPISSSKYARTSLKKPTAPC